jgi:hypothetical protein
MPKPLLLCIALSFAQLLVQHRGLAQTPVVVRVTAKGGLGDVIDVQVENASSLIAPDATGKTPVILPFLNGNPLKGSKVEYTDPTKGVIRFMLKRDAADATSKDAWNRVLGGPGPGVRRFKSSVGLEFGPPIAPKNP